MGARSALPWTKIMLGIWLLPAVHADADPGAAPNALRFSMTVQGVDCTALGSDASMQVATKDAVEAVLADIVGVGPASQVSLTSSCESNRFREWVFDVFEVEVLIEPDSSGFDQARVNLRGWMRQGGAQLGSKVVGAIEAVPGIGTCKSGDIAVKDMQAFVVEGGTQLEDLQAATTALKIRMTVKGVNCASLSSQESTNKGFKDAMGAVLADSVGVEEVFLNPSCKVLRFGQWSFEVFEVEVLIEPDSSSFEQAAVNLRGLMHGTGAQLSSKLVDAIEAVPGIGTHKSGDITFTGMQAFVVDGDTHIEDIQVATTALNIRFTVQGVNCAFLKARFIKEGFEYAVGAVLTDGVGVEEVFLNPSCKVLSFGQWSFEVFEVEALIQPDSAGFDEAKANLRGLMREGGAQLRSKLADAIEAVPSIGTHTSGDIAVNGMQAFVVKGDTPIDDLQALGSCTATEEAQVHGVDMCTCLQANDWVACYSQRLVSSGINTSCIAAMELQNVMARTDCACTLKDEGTCSEMECPECLEPEEEHVDSAARIGGILVVLGMIVVVSVAALLWPKTPPRKVAASAEVAASGEAAATEEVASVEEGDAFDAGGERAQSKEINL